MVNKLKQLVVEEEGQGLSEYGLVLAGIVVVAVAVVASLSGAITTKFNEIISSIKGGTTTP